jgi:hypothetical protein
LNFISLLAPLAWKINSNSQLRSRDRANGKFNRGIEEPCPQKLGVYIIRDFFAVSTAKKLHVLLGKNLQERPCGLVAATMSRFALTPSQLEGLMMDFQ